MSHVFLEWDQVLNLSNALDPGDEAQKLGLNVNAPDESGNTMLMVACEKGLETHVRMLLRLGSDPNLVDSDGRNALMKLCMSYNGSAVPARYNIARMLIDAGTNLEFVTEVGMCAVLAAYWGGDIEMIRLLIEYGAKVVHAAPCLALHNACAQDEYEFVELLLRAGADPNAVNESGETALFAAVGAESEKIADLLLDCGANVNARDSFGQTMLMRACFWKRHGLIKRFVNEGLIDIELTCNLGSTALYFSICENDQWAIEFLISRGANVKMQNVPKESPLMLACKHCNVDIVRLLLDNGAAVSSEDSERKTALFYATSVRQAETVRLLLERGAEVNLQDKRGYTALFVAASIGATRIAKMLVKRREIDLSLVAENGWNALSVACQVGSYEIVKVLLDCLIDVEIRDNEGDSPLLIASRYAHMNHDIIQLLVAHGADLNVQNRDGKSALMVTCERKDLEMVKFLVHAGANLGLQDTNGCTALILLCDMISIEEPIAYEEDKIRLEILEVLLNNDAQLDCQDKYGRTALMVACQNKHPTIPTLLINAGASIDLQNNAGSSALLYACFFEKSNHVELLLARGADVNITNPAGMTSLMVSCETNSGFEIVPMLVRNGADINMCSDAGYTALMLACSNALVQPDVIDFLLQNGAELEARNGEGSTALLCTCRNTSAEATKMAQILYSHGANLNSKMKNGNGALELAKVSGNTDLAIFLEFALSSSASPLAKEMVLYIFDYLR